MQITKEAPRAHVILATSEYGFMAWLTKSEPPSLLAAMHVQQLTLMSFVGLQEGYYTAEVIGDFPEPEAHAFFLELLSNETNNSQ